MVEYQFDNSTASTIWLSDYADTTSSSTTTTYWKVYDQWFSGDSYTTTNTTSYSDLYEYTKRAIRTTTVGDAWERYAIWEPKIRYEFNDRPLTPAERLREIIRTRQAPMIIGSRTPLRAAMDPKEARARETLLRVLGEEKFRGFMRNGFVSVRGKSGKVYQIFPGHGITKVYQNGKLVDRLCVVLQGSFPPTDSVIMRFLLILNDEKEFYRLAIKHSVTNTQRVAQREVDVRPLPEIYRGLVAA